MPGATKKGKRTLGNAKGGAASANISAKKAKLMSKDEELSEEENDDNDRKNLDESDEGSDGNEIDGETVDETRLRLAKEYLKVMN